MSKSDKKEKPILFNSEMVRAILDGRKTQTRRILKRQPVGNGFICSNGSHWGIKEPTFISKNSPYQVGDLLWVRESYWYREEDKMVCYDDASCRFLNWSKDKIFTKAGEKLESPSEMKQYGFKRMPSIFMPKALSRIWLEITAVRVERVQDISEVDAKAEGVVLSVDTLFPTINAATKQRQQFPILWNSINAKRGFSWESNPFVWVIEFKKAGKK